MQKRDNSKPSMDKNERKRGRPSGKNRVPLSLAERRARNAQYERERRNETSEAMVHLAEAACCDPQISNPELLATVINRLQNNKSTESIHDLKRINEDLESQIAALQNRLESDADFDEKHLNQSDGKSRSQSDSNSDTRSCEDRRRTKYRKTSKRNQLHDNARRISSSHPESSTDSQDSTWSHHLGKTIPTQPFQQLAPTLVQNKFDSDTTSSSLERTDSMSSETNSIQTRIKFEEDFYSESSEQSEEFPDSSSQQDMTVEIQLLPELNQIETVEQNKLNSIDPFTDGEKAILERLGWSDFINFEDAYNENQANLRWPVDYPGY